MRPRLKVLLLVGAVLSASPFVMPASATSPRCSESLGGDIIACGGGTIITTPPVNPPKQPAKPVSTGKKRKSAARYVAYWRLKEAPDGTLCETIGYRLVPPGANPADYDYDDPAFRGDSSAVVYLPCPRATVAGGPEPSTPSELALSFWEEIPLPVPEPRIAPGRAITGLPGYLETNGYTEADFSQTTPLGPMEIEAVGTYEVDWGDGSTAGPFDFEGDPWPDGDIVYTYQRVGRYDVVVTERWVATWRLGAESGVLTELSTSATIAAFPVEQIQAVVGR